jgi:hypothetical protein
VCVIKRFMVLNVIVLSCTLSVFSRESQIPVKKDNLYSVALFASLSEMEKSWGDINDSDGGSRIRTDYRNVPVEKDPEITDGLPSQQGDYRVEYLDSREQMDRYKRLGKAFAILRIRPMQSDGSTTLKIQVSVSYLTYKRHRISFAISDWSDVEFRYSCEKQRFIVSGVKLGGI